MHDIEHDDADSVLGLLRQLFFFFEEEEEDDEKQESSLVYILARVIRARGSLYLS